MKNIAILLLILLLADISYGETEYYQQAKVSYKKARRSSLKSDYMNASKNAARALEQYVQSGDDEKAREMRTIKEGSDAVIKQINDMISMAIQNKKIATGMSKEEVKLSWGEPKSINKVTGQKGTIEQWIYGETTTKTDKYVYFNEEGEVDSFQDK